MKFFGNPKTGSWSLIFSRPDGMACVIAAGEDLEVNSLAYAQNNVPRSEFMLLQNKHNKTRVCSS
jgi:hypothetical protein